MMRAALAKGWEWSSRRTPKDVLSASNMEAPHQPKNTPDRAPQSWGRARLRRFPSFHPHRSAGILGIAVNTLPRIVSCHCCLSGGMGIGMLKVLAPVPTPPRHELGGVVQTLRVEGHSAAQNMNPSIPEVVPAPAGATV